MPTGLQLNPPIQCCKQCGRKLSAKQIYKKRVCCSGKCRNDLNAATNNRQNLALNEPFNDESAAEFERAIALGKIEIRRDFNRFLSDRSPIDDSPEAERRLREVLVGGGVISENQFDESENEI